MAIDPKKHEMPSQEPAVRAHNFKEVALGYTMEVAVEEAKRCLNCKTQPCVSGCPVNINIPEASLKKHTRSSTRLLLCPQSAAVFAPRRASARASVLWA